jgi:hypothetical protein
LKADNAVSASTDVHFSGRERAGISDDAGPFRRSTHFRTRARFAVSQCAIPPPAGPRARRINSSSGNASASPRPKSQNTFS